ncbi:MAG: DNA polymerase III subunit delta' [SAR202 cluster bacterium]|jgi:DNA polymerase-3 subunit delta'|nr:DNA polymerase III subunit delta' [Dehalococcoidia bacterium]MQF87595.1 DNA polymerase III subunit delta' [SAR202 cluster bacterium]|tara:strand:- start:4973 stop:5992 length:1020 start_codon:yes stop_codon:yes gene_type:complete
MWTIFGQDHLLNRLEPSLKQRRQSHAYLLCGPPHVGKMALAINLSQAVNCLEGPGVPCGSCTQCARIAAGHHADILTLVPGQGEEGRSPKTVIGIDAIKEVIHRVSLNPFEGQFSVVIIDGAESMSDEAANALLKTLEEPPPNTMFLLLTADEGAILPTVRSRCQSMNLIPIPKNQMVERLIESHQATPEMADQLFRLSRGCLGWAIGALEDRQVLEQRQADLEKMQETLDAGLETRFTYANEVASLFGSDRDAAKDLLALWLRWWRDLLLIKEGAEEFLHNSDHAESLKSQASGLSTTEIVQFTNRLMQTLSNLDSNVSPRLAMEVLMLNLPIEAGQV